MPEAVASLARYLLDRVEDDLADVGILRTCVRCRGERGARRASIPGHDDSTPFAGLNGHPGCSTRSAVCLHRWLLGTACIVHNLAGICGARLVGHSKSVHPDRYHRGILYLSTHTDDAAFIGPPLVLEQRESLQ